MADVSNHLRITEIFFSLQGETTLVGLPTVFIRLTGCPLRCQYCDSAYAFQGGTKMTVEQILAEVKKYHTQYVCVTGGEPLAQKNSLDLMQQLCDLNYVVSLETSGALSIEQVDPRVIKILDIKTPGSKEDHRNHLENLNYLMPQDQIKFVICNQNDYDWVKQFIKHHQLIEKKNTILFSPSYQELNATELSDWILRDQLPVRLQIQLHKYLWGDVPGK